jgi:hypothetical protein
VADGLDNNTITYRNKGAAPGYEDYYGWNTGAEIHMGALYFSGDARDRFGTVIHELTHFGPPGTGDAAYFDNPVAFENPYVGVDWRDPDDTDYPITVTTGELIDNADSYAGFLTQFYYQ